MDILSIISVVISGLALCFSVYMFEENRHFRKKNDERLAQLEIAEKVKNQEEEKKAFIRCTPLKREMNKAPRFLVENVGKHEAKNVLLETPQFFQLVKIGLFPYTKLDPCQGVEVYYRIYKQGLSSIMLRFTYTDGTGQRIQEVALQV